ncbi:DUF2306 domain-containing protein [Nigerium massiliense]|uniref:DUF2306 domain-containing protein n=1 Tax=Nigerium massiliense TaxID=1522317 RepID=UPI0005900850|nr:DUF2306 domain-containing protein [Nigerium massiliense]
MEPLIAVHAIAASFVLTLGIVQLLRRRRDAAHRLLGRTWAAAMLVTCLTSFAIHPHGFSWLHGLALFTLASVTAGIVAIRRGNVRSHRANMTGSYIGTAVAFAFAAPTPQRAIARLAVTGPGELALAALLIAATSAALVTIVVSLVAGRRRKGAPARVA